MMHHPNVVQKLILSLCVLIIGCTSAPSTSPVPTRSTTDAELDAAIGQARASLDTFIEKIATPHTDRTFVAVKVRFYPPDESPQNIWVDEVTYADGALRGSIGDDIPTLRLEAGEKITIKEEDLLDWMIVEDGKLIGGYTIRLAVQRMSPEEKERFLETLDYSIED